MGEKVGKNVALVKVDVPGSLIAAASKVEFDSLPARTPKEHESGRPWPQHVLTSALGKWAKFIGVLVEAAGFRPAYGTKKEREEKARPRPRRIGAPEWEIAKNIERRTGIEGVRILRASLHLTSKPPSLVDVLRDLIQTFDVDEDAKIVALEQLLGELREQRASHVPSP